MASASLVAPAVVAVAATCIYYILKPKPLKGIPHCRLPWPLGDIPDMLTAIDNGRGEMACYDDKATEQGPIYQMVLGPFLPEVVVTDPKAIDDILRRRDDEFEHSDRFHVTFAWIVPKAMIGLRDGPMWKSHRKLMAPSMSPQYLSQMTPRISEHIRDLLALWEAKYQLLQADGLTGKAAFDATMDFQLFTLDSTGDISFTEKFGGLHGCLELIKGLAHAPKPLAKGEVEFPFPDTPQQGAIRHLFKVAGWVVSGVSPRIYYWWWGFLSPKWRRARSLIRGLIYDKIRTQRKLVKAKRERGDYEKKGGNADSVLEMIFEREGKDSPDVMPDDEIVDEMLLFLLAGQDTTSSAMLWGLNYLRDHPRVQKKLRAEMMLAFDITPDDAPGRTLTFDEVHSGRCAYLDAVIAEILRLAGTAPALLRQTKKDLHILGYFLPKGTEVTILNNYIATRHSVLEKDPRRLQHTADVDSMPVGMNAWRDDGLVFLPERWLDADGKFNPNMGPSFAFGAGKRSCAGQNLARLQLRLAFAAINLAFFLDAPPHPEMEDRKVMLDLNRRPRKCWTNLKKWELIED